MFKVRHYDQKLLRWWLGQRSNIDMDPPYQRQGHLWSRTDKAFLIDSILNDYDVPKIYIADFSMGRSKLNKRKLPFAIIDGKQRFEAVFDFYDGKVTLNDDFVYLEDRKLKLGRLGFEDLRKNYPVVADKFDNFNLSVMSVIADTEGPINELFLRLNRGKALSGAEVRNAMLGPVPKIVRRIVRHEFFASCIRFPANRGQDKNAAAKLLLFEFTEDFADTKKADLNRFTEIAQKKPHGRLELAGRHVVDTLDQMAGVFLPKDRLLGFAGIIPVYYLLVQRCILKAQLREFLVSFESQRRENRNRKGERTRLKAGDPELVEFDNFNRSTNDKKSHQGRYELLKKRYDAYLPMVLASAGRKRRKGPKG